MVLVLKQLLHISMYLLTFLVLRRTVLIEGHIYVLSCNLRLWCCFFVFCVLSNIYYTFLLHVKLLFIFRVLCGLFILLVHNILLLVNGVKKRLLKEMFNTRAFSREDAKTNEGKRKYYKVLFASLRICYTKSTQRNYAQ